MRAPQVPFVSDERLGFRAQPQNLHQHGVALFDFRQDFQAPPHTTKDIVLIVQPLLGTEVTVIGTCW